jgi:hypothetical protein
VSDFYFKSYDGQRWWRLFGYQLGYHPNGRRPLFSERYGYRRGPHELHVGKRVVSFVRLRKWEGPK